MLQLLLAHVNNLNEGIKTYNMGKPLKEQQLPISVTDLEDFKAVLEAERKSINPTGGGKRRKSKLKSSKKSKRRKSSKKRKSSKRKYSKRKSSKRKSRRRR